MISIPGRMPVYLIAMPAAVAIAYGHRCIIAFTGIPLEVARQCPAGPMTMISAVSNRMAMSRSFWNRKVVLFFAQFVPGLVHGSAVCRPGPNQATAHGKGTQVVPGQYVAGFFPSAEM